LEDDLNRTAELIEDCGTAMVMEAAASTAEENSDDPGAYADSHLSIDDLVKPADWPEYQNWGKLTVDASCSPATL
jgi:hypothetical protein